MCGITGFSNRRDPIDEAAARRMVEALRHRGPDDSGLWLDKDAGVFLGHTRLAILDLSSSGHQPMSSFCGRYVITYNGEIYNFRQLRADLEKEGVRFRGGSDTEVLLAAVSLRGIEAALAGFNGMFAFALWDRGKRTLHLVRDRLGEKPLYYGWSGKTFFFSSELKSLLRHPGFKGDVDPDVLALYLRHGYVPGPYSIYRGIFKLPPGTRLEIPWNAPEGGPLAPVPYWSALTAAEDGVARPFMGSEDDAVCRLEALLEAAVKSRMESDVPLGLNFSGGIDSSAVAAMMQKIGGRAAKTFTISFEEAAFDEGRYAAAIAGYLGTDHTAVRVTPREALAVIPRLPFIYDEPFADSSQIPTYLVSRLARASVTVSLSGDGGDEVFGGYPRYLAAPEVWGRVNRVPVLLRRMAASILRLPSPEQWERALGPISHFLGGGSSQSNLGDNFEKIAYVLSLTEPDPLYSRLINVWSHPERVLAYGREPASILTDQRSMPRLADFPQRMIFHDTVSYLPGDILVKVDRASMAVSLETRAPFLDHRLVEFAWTLPLSMKIRNGQGKWLLRQVLRKYVPDPLISRPKMGFGVPLGTWLRGPLRDWAEALLDKGRLDREGHFNSSVVRRKWADHLEKKSESPLQLWAVLMAQSWFEARKSPQD